MTEDTRLLELRYRRLLLAYPRAYRQATGQELLWVLLASAADGQRWPTVADAADLLRCGLLERFRVWRQPADEPCWRDGLALFSVAAPLVMLLAAVIDMAWWHLVGVPQIEAVAIAGTVLLGWRRIALAVTGLAICLKLTGLMFLGLLLPQWFLRIDFAPWRILATDFQLWFLLLEALALACSAGPRRGRRLLTWRGGIGLAVLGVLLSGLWPMDPVPVGLVGAAAFLLALAVLARSSRPGRWVAALLALVMYQYMLQFLPVMFWLNSPAMLTLRYLPLAGLTALMGAAVLRAHRRPGATGQAGSAGPAA